MCTCEDEVPWNIGKKAAAHQLAKERIFVPRWSSALKGGSFLCHASYCNRYRVAVRTPKHSRQLHQQYRLSLRIKSLGPRTSQSTRSHDLALHLLHTDGIRMFIVACGPTHGMSWTRRLAHAGDQGHLCWLTGVPQLLIRCIQLLVLQRAAWRWTASTK